MHFKVYEGCVYAVYLVGATNGLTSNNKWEGRQLVYRVCVSSWHYFRDTTIKKGELTRSEIWQNLGNETVEIYWKDLRCISHYETRMSHNKCRDLPGPKQLEVSMSSEKEVTSAVLIQGGSNMTGTDLCVKKPHCAAAARPWESEATTSTLPPARVRTCSVLSGSC